MKPPQGAFVQRQWITLKSAADRFATTKLLFSGVEISTDGQEYEEKLASLIEDEQLYEMEARAAKEKEHQITKAMVAAAMANSRSGKSAAVSPLRSSQWVAEAPAPSGSSLAGPARQTQPRSTLRRSREQLFDLLLQREVAPPPVGERMEAVEERIVACMASIEEKVGLRMDALAATMEQKIDEKFVQILELLRRDPPAKQ
eukprot:TRINITY_DN6828_c0_g1_i1.p1 TRINITY_DN6828_c0_g1~~TRINITY_DN6828_c0_g1_i1.p1  ORF type:complete len:201 (+),score=34.85 TRINITY_DN6828_c0_g1_i1:475-1077(+)